MRRLRERIQSMLYERTALSRKPEETIEHDLALLRQEEQMTPDLAFRDPYMLDFLGLADSYSEKDLESGIIAELQRFLVEMGSDFAFLARQKRIIIDNRDYYIAKSKRGSCSHKVFCPELQEPKRIGIWRVLPSTSC